MQANKETYIQNLDKLYQLREKKDERATNALREFCLLYNDGSHTLTQESCVLLHKHKLVTERGKINPKARKLIETMRLNAKAAGK